MGLLKCTEWIETKDDQGNVISVVSAAEGLVVNGVILGKPLEIDGNPNTAEFDDSMFPNGTIDGQGNITPDEEVE
jgi:hypothetical protein